MGVELKATLKIRKLFIPFDGKTPKIPILAQPSYTPGSRLPATSRLFGDEPSFDFGLSPSSSEAEH
jgi:hypothetical protein